MREHLHSSQQARGLMQYPCSQREGWRIGSGMAGECQQARGRSSSHRGRNAISSRHMSIPFPLRTAVWSERWDEAWQETVDEYQHQRHLRRQRKASPRLCSLISSWLLLLFQFRLPTRHPCSSEGFSSCCTCCTCRHFAWLLSPFPASVICLNSCPSF